MGEPPRRPSHTGFNANWSCNVSMAQVRGIALVSGRLRLTAAGSHSFIRLLGQEMG